MDASNYLKALMVQIAWQYADEGFNTRVGVLLCLRNRVCNDDWDTILQTEMESLKYSKWMDTRDPEALKLLAVVDQIFEGTRRDITNGCTYFTRDTNDTIVQGRAYEVKIGNLFYYTPLERDD